MKTMELFRLQQEYETLKKLLTDTCEYLTRVETQARNGVPFKVRFHEDISTRSYEDLHHEFLYRAWIEVDEITGHISTGVYNNLSPASFPLSLKVRILKQLLIDIMSPSIMRAHKYWLERTKSNKTDGTT